MVAAGEGIPTYIAFVESHNPRSFQTTHFVTNPYPLLFNIKDVVYVQIAILSTSLKERDRLFHSRQSPILKFCVTFLVQLFYPTISQLLIHIFFRSGLVSHQVGSMIYDHFVRIYWLQVIMVDDRTMSPEPSIFLFVYYHIWYWLYLWHRDICVGWTVGYVWCFSSINNGC